ncbi:MAG: Glycosyl transferase, family 2 [Candidatus Magasanikbacteria bacterium GW2011_GWA2_56_11]|uniref:Glycosyl transferase, family 2 n=1 Tax=Candidatus Magasanikbacteria bacterium GW2011_GWA2_56_11 TaxID=1619044 RepID=A0A0G1YES7_9BACT|nr:MAG: Glycosyl transferase, family 2 [Candidatus Magasanikbacteria bacterium GW2011_GWA2_56_11]
MKPIIVIPTYNERDNIATLVSQIFALRIPELEIVVVDDNSPDKTAEVVEGMRADYPVHLVKRLRKLGLGSAYIAGFKKALALGADYIFEMDADFSHDPADLPRLLSAAADHDLAIGSRKILGGKIVGWSLWRRLSSAGAMFFSRLLLGLRVRDVTAGFRCFRSQALKSIALDTVKSNGYAFQEELLYRAEQAGFSIIEVPVVFNDRRRGRSKLSKKDIWEFFTVMYKLKFSRRPPATS